MTNEVQVKEVTGSISIKYRTALYGAMNFAEDPDILEIVTLIAESENIGVRCSLISDERLIRESL